MKAGTRIACGVLIGWGIVACCVPLVSQQANVIRLEHILAPPSLQMPLGGDDLGRSLAARVAVGARLSLIVATIVVSVSAVFGVLLGLIGAWFGGWVDLLLVRIIDIFLAFPGLLLAIALAGMLGPGMFNLVFSLAMVGWVGFARLARAQALSVKERDHVLSAVVLGTSARRIVWQHVLPLISGPLIVEASFGIASVIVAEAGLSFLGLGVQPPDPSWGSMIRDGTRYMLVAPHFVLVPGLALMSAVIAINLLGDRLRDYWHRDRSE